MAYLQHNDKQITLRAGEMTIGGPSADIPLDDAAAVVALVVSGASDVVVKRAAADSQVKVNGVQLGVEPTPLIHGDRIEVGASVLIFGDAAKSGSTAYFSGANVAELLKQREGASASSAPAAAAPAVRVPTANTGGRLVSLVDGREYAIVRKPFTIGRDPACDVVIASGDVSRSHAEIESGDEGYYVIDTSTNGVNVNGNRVDGTFTLARGDVIRVGPEEFRFYADKATAKPAPVPVVEPPAAAPVAPVAPVAAPSAPAAPRPALATLELALPDGPKTIEIVEVLSQVGRGKHNDIVIPDGSVSDSHAKIQRRADGWFVVDMGSTNGVYVGGTRISGETQLGASTQVRFGAIEAKFVLAGAPSAPVADGRTAVLSGAEAQKLAQAAIAAKAAAMPAPVVPVPATPPVAVPSAAPVAAPKSGGVPGWVWFVAVLVVGGVAVFLFKGR